MQQVTTAVAIGVATFGSLTAAVAVAALWLSRLEPAPVPEEAATSA